jgi:hypothetical protein
MSAADKFLQFPLCVLAWPGEAKETLNAIIDYGLTEAGLAIISKRSIEERRALCAEYGLLESQVDSWALAAKVGAELCDIRLGSLEGCVRRHSTMAVHLRDWETRHGPDALVRMRKDVCFEVRDGGGMSFREFRILCAIYSLLGKHRYRAIGFRMIGARACGCKSEGVMASELRAGRPLPALFTIKQLRGTVAKLHELGWFARVTPNPHGRVTYYSHRMSGDELRERIFHRRTYSAGFHEDQRRQNAALAERIRKKMGSFHQNSDPQPSLAS